MRDAVPPCGTTGGGGGAGTAPDAARTVPDDHPGRSRRAQRTRGRLGRTITASPRAPPPSTTPSHKADAGRAPERSSRGAIPRPCSAAAARGGPAPHRRTGTLRRMGRMGSDLGGPGRGRVQICHKGVSRRDRPRAEARNINDSLSALRRDGGPLQQIRTNRAATGPREERRGSGCALVERLRAVAPGETRDEAAPPNQLPRAADDEDHDADPAPEHPRRPGEKGSPRPMGADHHHIAPPEKRADAR